MGEIMSGKISVIMPAYNAEATIAKSMESVLKQTYQNLELIVIDDDSVDKTAEIVRKYQKRDKRIRYEKKDNEGVSSARNLGLDIAKGDYISFLDADDLWKPIILERLYTKMQSATEIHFVYGRTQEVFTDGRKQLLGCEPSNPEGYLENFFYKTNELRLGFHISALLIDRSVIEQNNLRFKTGIKISEDTGFFIELICVTKAYQVNEILSYYMRRTGSATANKWKPTDWDGQVLIYEHIESFVRIHRPEAYPAFQRMRNYVAYHFVRNCIRHKEISAAQKYIQRWHTYLQGFSRDRGKLMNRLKCYLMLQFANNDKLLAWIGNL